MRPPLRVSLTPLLLGLVLLTGCRSCRVHPGLDDTGEGGTGSDDTSGGDAGTGGDDTSTGTGGDDTSTGTGGDDTGDPPLGSPNILLLIADDLGLDLAAFDPADPCYDVAEVEGQPVMPRVAALCAEGVRFETAWAQPTCSPVRASMLTGQSPWQHGLGAPVHPETESNVLDTSAFTLPRAMSVGAPDYAVASFGKWHVSKGVDDPNLAGWPHYAGHLIGTLDSYTSWERNENGVVEACEDYATTRTVDDALAWLGEVEAGSPWFMWVGFNAPHDPFHLPPAELHGQDELGEYSEEEPSARPWVAAMSEAMDTELGRLLDEVQARGEWERTVVIFLGDNGTDNDAVADPIRATRAKGTLYRGGIQVPLVVGGGAVAGGGRTVPHLVQASDLYATVLELAGVDAEALRAEHAPDEPSDSVSFARHLFAEEASHERERVLAQAFPAGASTPDGMRHTWSDGRWKVACRSDSSQLFDLEADPWEDVDLLSEGEPSDEVLAVLAQFRGELEALFGVTGLCPLAEEDTGGAAP